MIPEGTGIAPSLFLDLMQQVRLKELWPKLSENERQRWRNWRSSKAEGKLEKNTASESRNPWLQRSKAPLNPRTPVTVLARARKVCVCVCVCARSTDFTARVVNMMTCVLLLKKTERDTVT